MRCGLLIDFERAVSCWGDHRCLPMQEQIFVGSLDKNLQHSVQYDQQHDRGKQSELMPVQRRSRLGQFADRMCYRLWEHLILWRTCGGQLDWVRMSKELQVEVRVEYLHPLLWRYWIYSASVEFARRHHLPLPARLYLERLKQAVLIQLFDGRKLDWHGC